ncbi:N-acetylmuramoyl-L-alanine amidase [Erythrobacter sp. GH1-10]|uniref:N-acetylmuramoyl-L-alanine amidase n=1 Tax=Erythrobacter sp. GH1-10 TaxID=3349334 RepID=UPI003877C8EB
MKAQIRPNRIDISDRFPLASFTIMTDGQPRLAEIVLATDPALFASKEGRSRSTFFTTKELGVLSLPRAEAVYTVPPEVLARFTDAERLWFGLATAPANGGQKTWTVDVMPTGSSPYISLSGLNDRSLRRVRMYPRRTGQSGYGEGAPKPLLEWAGDAAQSGTSEVGAQPQPNGSNGNAPPAPAPSPAPSNVPYDDGFGPLPPRDAANGGNGNGNGNGAQASPEAQGFGAKQQDTMSDAERDRLDDQGIDGPVPDVPPSSQPSAMEGRPRALRTAEYEGARVMPSPAYSPGRRGTTIDRIAIHITDGPQSRWLGSWFTREEANSSSHYMVDQEGVIRQFVREQDTAWHAGNRAANRRSIGIEHVAVKRGGATYGQTTYPYTPPTEEEYRASARLVAHLCRKYGLEPNRTTIVGHNEINARTGHSSCPTGAWDWDHYMPMVAEEYARVGGVGAGQSYSLGLFDHVLGRRVSDVVAETARNRLIETGNYTFGENRRSIRAPQVRELTTAEQTALEVLLAAAGPLFSVGRLVANEAGASIAIGVGANIGAAEGASIGGGIIFAPQGRIGIYGLGQIDIGEIFSGSVTLQVTIIDGGIEAFNGMSTVVSVSGGEVYVGGASAIFNDRGNFVGVTFEAGLGFGSPLSVYVGVQRSWSTTVGQQQGLVDAYGMSAIDPESRGVECCGGSHARPAPASALELTDAEYDGVSQVRVSPHFTPGRSGRAIDRIVIHITDAPTASSTINHLTDATRENGSSAHYLVAPDGAITQFVSEADTAWHAVGGNSRSIGIEHVAVKTGGATYGQTTYPHQPPTDAEYRASARLVAHLCHKYGLPADRTTIVGHNQIDTRPRRAQCPDGAWSWDTYMAMVAEEFARIGGAVGGVGAQSFGASQTINWDMVQVVPQPTNRSCWATAGAMLYGWQNHQSVSPATIAEFAGKTTGDYLNAGRFQEFADAIGFDYDYGQSYTPEGFFGRLEEVGPLLVLKNNPPILHCVIVTGMYKDGAQWYVRVADPWDRAVGTPGAPGRYASTHTTGSRYIQKYEDFVAEYEGSAGVADLQVLHAGGHHGHTPNRGATTPAGYAMSGDIPLDPGEGGMSIGKSALKPGDIIVTTTAAPVSGIIRQATDQPVSHVMLYVGQGGQVIEARGDGVRLKPIEEALQGATLAVAYRSPEVDEMKGLEIADKAAQYLDSGFDYVGIVKAGLFRLAVQACQRRGLSEEMCRSLVAWKMDGSASADRFFCSALVLRSYEDAGQRLTVSAPNWASPGDIPEQTLRDGALGYVGHLVTPQTPFSGTQAYSGAFGNNQSRTINWDDVQLVPQPTDMSCWATSAAMVIGWRDRQSVTAETIADIARRNIKQPISGQDFDDFADEVGLTYEPAQSLPPEEWFALLETKGPLFVAEIPSNFGHVVVVTGMYNDGGQWYVRVTDPWDRVVGTPGSPGAHIPNSHSTGSRYILTFEQFVADYERAAPHATVQVLHANGTHGHTPNRGTSTPPGYALSKPDNQAVMPDIPVLDGNVQTPAGSPSSGAPSPSLNGEPVADHPFGPGVTVTRQVIEKGKRRYDLAQLRGFVNPQTGAMVESDAMRAEPVLLNDWPYIDGAGGRTQAGVAIDWAFKGGAVGEIGITPLDGASPDGWDIAVRADLVRGTDVPGKAQVCVRVTTTFTKAGESEQVAVSEVKLDGDGRSNVQHGVGQTGEVETQPTSGQPRNGTGNWEQVPAVNSAPVEA